MQKCLGAYQCIKKKAFKKIESKYNQDAAIGSFKTVIVFV